MEHGEWCRCELAWLRQVQQLTPRTVRSSFGPGNPPDSTTAFSTRGLETEGSGKSSVSPRRQAVGDRTVLGDRTVFEPAERSSLSFRFSDLQQDPRSTLRHASAHGSTLCHIQTKHSGSPVLEWIEDESGRYGWWGWKQTGAPQSSHPPLHSCPTRFHSRQFQHHPLHVNHLTDYCYTSTPFLIHRAPARPRRNPPTQIAIAGVTMDGSAERREISESSRGVVGSQARI